MKKILYSIVVLLFSFQASSQDLSNQSGENQYYNGDYSGISVQKIKLANGLSVYLNPDPNMKDVLGAIVVKGGSKYDPKGASGTAHYFEHIMFKGSQTLGTVNYKEEKVYLDSIRAAYDLLALSKDDPVFHAGIMRNINRLSQKASEYAIPNEFNKVLSSIGGTRINAYTTYENIVYHNHFPAESLEKWIALQVDRFNSPVFRLFQTELETVYEEKNMSMDNMFRHLFQEVYKNFYPNSVYGQQTVLGSIEDLKYPSISKMETYYKDYYVANNMALVLVGNFDAEMTIQLLENSFGKWRDGQFQNQPDSREQAFEGRVEVKEKITPVAVGILGFRTVPKGHPDELGLEIINELLSNGKTGLLDVLVSNQKVMEAGAFSDLHYDIGGNFVYFVPKLVTQSLKNAEKLVLAQLDSLKNGNFSDNLFQAVLVNKQKNMLMNLENADYRSHLIIDAYMSNQSVNKVLSQILSLEQVDKATIIKLAQKYYGSNYLAFMSKMGSKKKTKLEKPNFSPLNPMNKDASSKMAEKIKNMDMPEVELDFIRFNEDVQISDIYNNLHLYYTSNPMNNVYSINYNIGLGTYDQPKLELLASYLNQAGTTDLKFTEFRTKLQTTGTSINMYVSDSYFHIYMSGFDKNISSDLEALKQLLTHPEQNESILKQLAKEEKLNYKVVKQDVGMQSKVLNNYALYGDNSPDLQRLGVKDVKKESVESLQRLLIKLLKYETNIHYVGTTSNEQMNSMLLANNPFSVDLRRSTSPIDRIARNINDNQVYFMENKKAIQSHIRFSIPSKKADATERIYAPAFNRYFGLGMSSIVFREIREFRSLAYGTYAYVSTPFNFNNPARFNAMMTTQADKTNKAIKVMLNLMDSMPGTGEDIEPLKQSILRSYNSQLPGFRQNSILVAYWMRQGYTQDPRINQAEKIKKLGVDDIMRFYNSFVSGRSHNISVVGDSKRIDMEKLENRGQFTKLKLKDIYKK